MKTNISGTISKDARPNSGLDEIGDKLHANQLQRYIVVGIVEYHGFHHVKGKAESVTVEFAAIEPLLEGKDEMAARKLLDNARKARGLAAVELTLFDVPDDDQKGPWPGDADFKAPQTGPGRTPAARKDAPKADDTE